MTCTNHRTATLGSLNLLTRTRSEDIAKVVFLIISVLLIKYNIRIEISSENRILQLNRCLLIVLMRIDGLNLIFCQTGNRLKFLGNLIQHLRRILRVDYLTYIYTIVIAVDAHNIVNQLE